MGEIRCLDATGDLKLIWDKSRPEEVASVRKQVEDLLKKGYQLFRVEGEKGDKGARIDAFDPTLERAILTPAVVGG